MSYRRAGSKHWYIDLRLPDGRVALSTRTANKRTADSLEDTLRAVQAQGRTELLTAVRRGDVTLARLQRAFRQKKLDDLVVDDRPLEEVVAEWSRTRDYECYKRMGRQLVAYVNAELETEEKPGPARVSWLAEETNIRKFVGTYAAADLSPATERKAVSGLKLLVGYALGSTVRAAVFPRGMARSPTDPEERALEPAEIARIREHSGELWLLIATSLATGVRKGELLRLRRSDLAEDFASVTIPKGKSAQAARTIPLTGEASALLRSWVTMEELSDTDRLWPTVTANWVTPRWTAIRKAVGLWHPDPDDPDHERHARWHDFRHTWAASCARSGMPLGELQVYGGWKNLAMVQRYAKYQPPKRSTHLEAAAERMGIGVILKPDIPATDIRTERQQYPEKAALAG